MAKISGKIMIMAGFICLMWIANLIFVSNAVYAEGINPPPVVSNSTKTGTEDTIMTFTAEDFNNASVYSDVYNEPLINIQVVTLSDIAHGALLLNGAEITAGQVIVSDDLCNITFAPAVNFYGNASFTWKASDGTEYSATSATMTLGIAGVNDAPVIFDSIKYCTEDVVLQLSTDDFGNASVYSDVEGNQLQQLNVGWVPDSSQGALVINGYTISPATGITTYGLDLLTFVPAANFHGDAIFRYHVIDSNIGFSTNSAAMTFRVVSVNDAPVVSNSTKNGTEETTMTFIADDFNSISGYSDVEGDALNKIQVVTLPDAMHGKLFLNGVDITAGQDIAVADLAAITFVPATDFYGDASFTWKANDGTDYSTTAVTMTLSIANVNDAPVVSDSTKNGTEETTMTFTADDFNSISGYSDVEGDALNKIQVLTLPDSAAGVLYLSGTAITAGQEIAAAELANITFVPAADFYGDASFIWKASDGADYSPTAAATTLSINGVPVVSNSLKNGTEDTTMTFTAEDFNGASVYSDPENDLLSKIQVVTLPDSAAGVLNLNGTAITAGQEIAAANLANISFVPAANFYGNASFTWKASDGADYSPTAATMTLSINGVPVVSNSLKNGTEDTTMTFAAEDFNGASVYSDPENDVLSKIQVVTLPDSATGVLNLNGTAITAEQEIVAADLANITFVPAANFYGDASFTWKANDGADYSPTAAAMTLSIAGVNDAPVIFDSIMYCTEDVVLQLSVDDFGNASVYSDVEGDQLYQLGVGWVPDSSQGALVISGIHTVAPAWGITRYGLDVLTFVPAANFHGDAIFRYDVLDSGFSGYSNSATMTFRVASVNDAPVVSNSTKNGTEETTMTFTADDFNSISGYSDVEGDALNQIQVVTLPDASHGKLFLNGVDITAGQDIAVADLLNITFVPAADFYGDASFTWKANDGADYSTTAATMTLSIVNVNDAPVVSDSTKNGTEDMTMTFAADDFSNTSVYYDVDSDVLSKIEVVTLPDSAAGVLNLNGTAITAGQEIAAAELANITFVPAADFYGDASFTWKASDGADYSTTAAAMTLSINGVPVVSNSLKNGTEDTTMSFTAEDFNGASVYSDPENDLLNKIQVVTLPDSAAGVLNLNGTAITAGQEIVAANLANITFVPAADFYGDASFTWKASDGADYSPTAAAMTLSMATVNDAPVVSDSTKNGTEDMTMTFAADDFSNASVYHDADSDVLSKIEVVTLPDSAAGVLNLNGTAITAGQEIAVADLANITFVPAANFYGNASFTWKANDGADYSPTSAAMTLSMASVNDAPVVSDSVKNGTEDITMTFAADDFSNASVYHDADSDVLSKIEVVTLPDSAAGVLYLSGTAITAGQEIAAANLANISFVPAADFHGDVSFTWKGSEGREYSVTVATVTMRICSISLASINIAEASLNPAFGRDITNYRADVPNRTTSILLMAVTEDSDALVRINEILATSGESITISHLNTGYNTIVLTVEDPNSSLEKVYTISIYRKPNGSGMRTTPETTDGMDINPGALTGTAGRTTEVKTELATVTLPSNMLTPEGAGNATSVTLTVSVADTAKLPAEVQAQIGNRPVVEITLKLDGKTTPWSNPDAPVTVSIPYKPTAEELANPEKITVWYIDGAGHITSVPSGRYDPATGTVSFTTTHFSEYAVVYVSKSFDDLAKTPWAKKQIEVMASKGIINGISKDTFSPVANITRADYLVLLVKALGLTTEFNSNFDDVEQGTYYYEAAGIAKKLGITAGTGNNRFCPKENISRQDMMVMAARALKKLNKLGNDGTSTALDKFKDKGDIAGYAMESLAVLVRENLIAGTEDMINPRVNTTRAEAAVFFYRIYNK